MRGIRLAPSAAIRAVTSTQQSVSTIATRRAFSTTQRKASGHGPEYDPPTGWLFGVKPGEKYQNEGWEHLFFYGFCGSFAVFAVALAFKPDTT